ncbi:MAG: hypothetical protein K6347_03805 [Campylobacterales bacterium]
MRKTPRGFRRRYFTLAAIQAMVAECKEKAVHSRVRSIRFTRRFNGVAYPDEDPPEDLPPALQALTVGVVAQQSTRCPCHCNRIFATRAHAILYLTQFLRRICPCRKTKTGLAPPLIIL